MAEEEGNWERIGGLTIPTWVGVEKDQPLPKAEVDIVMKIRGGGLDEGDEAEVVINTLILDRDQHLLLDVEQFFPHVPNPNALEMPTAGRVSLHVGNARPKDGEVIWTIKMAGDEN